MSQLSIGTVAAIPSPAHSYLATLPTKLLSNATLKVDINGTQISALMDSGSSESFIRTSVAEQLKLNILPSNHSISMASTSLSAKVQGFCMATNHTKEHDC